MSAHPRPTLVVLTRYPVPGHVKTRLVPALGAERAADLHRELAERTLAVAREARAVRGCAIEVHYDGGDRASFAAWLGNDLDYEPQAGDDLGARLRLASEAVLLRRRGPVVLIGTDCPALATAHLASTFAGLAGHDHVVGPARDGGYYLLGLRRPSPELFVDVPWGTDRVLARTLEAIRAAGRTVLILEPLADIDRPEDLPLLPDDLARHRG